MDGERQPLPKVKLAQVGLAAVFEAVSAITGRHPLVKLIKPGIKNDAVLFH
jgi:hypothetical protein